MSLPTYEEIKSASSIVEFVANNTNPLYSSLKIYGSVEMPLYSATEVAKLLEIDKVDNVVKHFTNRECIYANVPSINGTARLLTEHGLYRLLFINNTPVGEVFREFVYMVLDQLKTYKTVHLDSVQDSMRKQFSAEIQQATKYLQEKVQQLELEVLANSKTLRRTSELAHRKEQEAANLSQHAQQLNTKVLIMQERLLRAELNNQPDDESDEALFKYLLVKYMKVKLYVYLMPCKNESDDHYDYSDFSYENIPDENDEMYYRLSRNNTCVKGSIIKDLYFEHENQFNDLKNSLATFARGDSYLCELSTINENYLAIRSQPIAEKKKIRKAEINNILSNIWK